MICTKKSLIFSSDICRNGPYNSCSGERTWSGNHFFLKICKRKISFEIMNLQSNFSHFWLFIGTCIYRSQKSNTLTKYRLVGMRSMLGTFLLTQKSMANSPNCGSVNSVSSTWNWNVPIAIIRLVPDTFVHHHLLKCMEIQLIALLKLFKHMQTIMKYWLFGT